MLTRRHLLQGTALGLGLLTLPGGLSACAKTGVVPPAPGGPQGFGVDDAALRRIFTELGSRGATFADAFFQYTRSNSLTLEDGIISRASTTVDRGVGLRVVIGDQTGFAFTEDLSEEAMLAAARTAAAIASGAQVAPPDAFARVAPTAGLYSVAVPWSAVGVDQKLPVVSKVDRLIRGLDPLVTKVSVTLVDEEQEVLVANLSGRILHETRPQTRLMASVTAQKNGVTQSNGANLAGRKGLEFYSDEALAQLAKDAVDRTMILFEAKRPPAGEMPVVLAAGASGILLHEAIGHGLEADYNRKGASIYSTMVGQKIGPDFATIVDSGVIPHERGAIAFDDEGNPTERTVLVEGGVLRGYLHDQISARHYGVAATGSGRRQSFRHPPLPRMRCTYMENGPHTRDEIIAAVPNGIIAETFTNGQVAIGAGDYTFYIKNGWLIEGGRITAPIKDVNIIGNGPASLRAVTMAANDGHLDTGGWTCGKDGQSVPVSQGLPTVLVSKMTVGGTDA